MTAFQKKKINLIKNKMIRKIKKVVHIHQNLKNQKQRQKPKTVFFNKVTLQ